MLLSISSLRVKSDLLLCLDLRHHQHKAQETLAPLSALRGLASLFLRGLHELGSITGLASSLTSLQVDAAVAPADLQGLLLTRLQSFTAKRMDDSNCLTCLRSLTSLCVASEVGAWGCLLPASLPTHPPAAGPPPAPPLP